MRVVVMMDKLHKDLGGKCHFTVFNQEDFAGPSSYIVWSFTKHWRYTHAVNHRFG